MNDIKKGVWEGKDAQVILAPKFWAQETKDKLESEGLTDTYRVYVYDEEKECHNEDFHLPDKIIIEHLNELVANHSNILGVFVGIRTKSGKWTDERAIIVVVNRPKGLIPFGEKEFPKIFHDFRVDIVDGILDDLRTRSWRRVNHAVNSKRIIGGLSVGSNSQKDATLSIIYSRDYAITSGIFEIGEEIYFPGKVDVPPEARFFKPIRIGTIDVSNGEVARIALSTKDIEIKRLNQRLPELGSKIDPYWGSSPKDSLESPKNIPMSYQKVLGDFNEPIKAFNRGKVSGAQWGFVSPNKFYIGGKSRYLLFPRSPRNPYYLEKISVVQPGDIGGLIITEKGEAIGILIGSLSISTIIQEIGIVIPMEEVLSVLQLI